MTKARDPFASIAFQPRKDYREFWYRLAVLIKERHGSAIHLYAATKEEVRYYRELDTEGVFDSFNIAFQLLVDAVAERGLDETEVMRRAREMEAYTGTTINAVAATDRHLGRGYSPAGFYFPRSHISEKTSYAQMVHGVTRLLQYWDDEIRSKGISLIMGGNKFQGVMARVHGLPWCSHLNAGYKTFEYWTKNEFNENDELEGAFLRLTPEDLKITSIPHAYDLHLVLRVPMLAYARIPVFAMDVLTIVAKHVYGLFRGYEKSRRMYLLGSVLAQRYRRWRGLRWMAGPAVQPLEALDGKRFVFFPLQTEPESSLSFASPEFLSQHHAIVQISRNLPAGVLLAVKDHILAVSRRPANFYDQLKDLKNVVLLDARALGIEAVRRSIAVANVVGTAGMEAAVMGKPVITFGRHNLYNFLDHVFVVTKEIELAGLLARVADGTAVDANKAESDGLRYLNALISISFDARAYRADGTPEVSAASIEDAYKTLCRAAGTQPLGPHLERPLAVAASARTAGS